MDEILREIENYEKIVPFADEATMVLKAHLLMEQSLWKFVAERIEDAELLTALRAENSGVRDGKALVQLAQALSTRDDVPIHNEHRVWPALHTLNSLRNKLAHELEPDRKKVERYMREFSKALLGDITGHLNRDFYYAAMIPLADLGINRVPGTWSDTQ